MNSEEHLPELRVCNIFSQPSDVECGDGLVLRYVQSGHGGGPRQEFVSHRIINAIVTVLNVLISQRVIWIGGLLMPVIL